MLKRVLCAAVGLGCEALAAAAVCSSAQSAFARTFADTPGETVAYPIGAAQGA